MIRENVPVYLITGFLESGKTSFLKSCIAQESFRIREKTLLLITEEGEEEYDPKVLQDYNVVTEVIDAETDFTPQKLTELDRKHRPFRVLMEYNPLWSVGKFYDMNDMQQLPRSWQFVQHIVTVDASTYQVYQNNMKSVFMDMFSGADMVAFNRCTKDMPLANYRRSVKAANQQCSIIFEDTQGEIMDTIEDIMPFDLNAEVICIDDMDFGVWYIDVQDHPERYEGKKVRFLAQVSKSRKRNADFFVPGRRIMTCCANDIRFVGYLCKYDKAPELIEGDWVEVEALMRSEYSEIYHDEGPVLHALKINQAKKPKDELVYFN